MSQPQNTPPEEPAPNDTPARIPTPPPEQEEADSLLPVLAMILAAYLAWRAVRNRAETPRTQLLELLGIAQTMSYPLERSALRILTWQRGQYGRAGDELLPHVAVGVAAGVRAGIEVIEDTIVDWDDDGRLDVMDNRPAALAALARGVARTLSNAAMEATAQAAGWRAKTWHTQQDARVRSTHRVMHGQRRATGEKFTAGDGSQLDYPGDPTVAAELWVNCRCFLTLER